MTMDMSEIYPGETWLELKSGGKGTIMLDGDELFLGTEEMMFVFCRSEK